MAILTSSSINGTDPPAPGSTVQRTSLSIAPARINTPGIVAPVPATPPSTDLDQIQLAVDRLKQSMKPSLANSLEFQIDKSTGKAVVMIFDAETHKLVRQIPSQEVMAIAEAIDRMQGRGGLVKQKA